MAALAPAADYAVRDQERMRAAQRYFQWQTALAKPWLGQRVLEEGCGVGNFTRHILDHELVVGIDVEADRSVRHRENHRGFQNVVSLKVNASDAASVETLNSYRPDSVVSLNVLEHIEDDMEHCATCGGSCRTAAAWF
jgi:2-polyprenyl-3-methyl-5-hydroxy-6-metoxy-1,4-benzoquinol methylase